MQVDPMEPPKFNTSKKIPRGPPSPPVPVLHSPTRKLTAKEQQDWKIPPCVSNWKNAKGYTIPLDKRLAADGRGLQVGWLTWASCFKMWQHGDLFTPVMFLSNFQFMNFSVVGLDLFCFSGLKSFSVFLKTAREMQYLWVSNLKWYLWLLYISIQLVIDL